VLRHALSYFKDRIVDLAALGSGFRFENVLEFVITFAENHPFSASSLNLVLPDILRRKLINLTNPPGDDDRCFKRAVRLHPNLRPPFRNNSSRAIYDMLKRKSYYDQFSFGTKKNTKLIGME